MTLAEAQDLFAALVTGERPVDPAAREALLVGDAGLSADERARIYSEMYLFRLVEALREDYPLLARLLGEEEFFSVCAAYVRAHPSRHPSLARLGAALPGFLRDRAVPRPDLSDLAALEWARAEAFVAPDAAALDETALRSLGEDPASARLTLVPSIRLLSLGYDAAALWADLEALRQPGPALPGPTWLLVWRKGFEVFHAEVSPEELAALSAVQRGATLGEACEAFAALADPARAALDALASWSGERLIARIDR
ncbi:MAG TPA: DNA-binding domain-containing protein [Myxococcales bacterium]|nr:DNA-binding domain-containing protein [Myxococcales bacterium]